MPSLTFFDENWSLHAYLMSSTAQDGSTGSRERTLTGYSNGGKTGKVKPQDHTRHLTSDRYDWRAEEAALNKELPMFTRDITIEGHGALNIHYVHQKSAVEGAIPLLFVHGCMCPCILPSHKFADYSRIAGPGSFIEVRKVLPLLVAPDVPDAPAFHVVALGLPGYAFSEAAKRPGFGPKEMAEV